MAIRKKNSVQIKSVMNIKLQSNGADECKLVITGNNSKGKPYQVTTHVPDYLLQYLAKDIASVADQRMNTARNFRDGIFNHFK